MTHLSEIRGIGKSSLELLEAAGFLNAESLATAGVEELVLELGRANEILRIAKRAPTKSAIAKWIDAAREITGIEPDRDRDEPAPTMMPVNYEASAHVVSMLAAAPFAIPLPARLLVENQLVVSDIPPAILLNRYVGDLDVRVEARLPRQRQKKAAAAAGTYVKIADNIVNRPVVDPSKFRSTEEVGDRIPMPPPALTTSGNERVALIRTPRRSTNEGRDPKSRRYIRGVLHSHPASIVAGAVVTLLLMFMTPLAILSSMLLLVSGEMPDRFSWVPGWLLGFPLSLPFFAIAYLIWGMGGSCRVCGQKLFLKRGHFKNAQAHYVKGLGYILPLCFQILLFRWFRCTHCGTPVRLKE